MDQVVHPIVDVRGYGILSEPIKKRFVIRMRKHGVRICDEDVLIKRRYRRRARKRLRHMGVGVVGLMGVSWLLDVVLMYTSGVLTNFLLCDFTKI